jgi:predicted phosphodiesterase
LLALPLVIALSSRNARAQTSELRFALLGDPQIGYGPGAEWSDLRRFEKVIDDVNTRAPSFALIAGDLVQSDDFAQRWLFRHALGQFKVPTHLVAGNHDVDDEESLAQFRRSHGEDYYDFAVGNAAFVVLNSETARDGRISRAEYQQQWRFIEQVFNRLHDEQRAPIFVVTHRPPFVNDESEQDTDQNWPLEARTRLLAKMRASGAQWILAGHLHIRHELTTADGIHLVVVPGSARSFDQSPVGYRLFNATQGATSSEWQTVAPAPSEPWHVPGFSGWTPRLADFSVRHWLFTLLYCGTGSLAWRAARKLKGRRAGEPRIWRGIAYALFFFGANMQLDLDEFLQESARIAAKVTGIYVVRHLVTGGALVLGLLIGVVWFYRSVKAGSRSPTLLLALAALGVPGLWFVLSVISHHYIGMLFAEDWWDLLTLLALSSIVGAALAPVKRSTQQQ